MIQIEQYILLPLFKRQTHLKLSEACIERGGNPALISYIMRGALAHMLDTSIPYKNNVEACHACNNGLCSNPNHLYWGTRKENNADYVASVGYKSIWQRMVENHGIEKAKQIQSLSGRHAVSAINQQRKQQRISKGSHRALEALTDARKIAERNSQYGTCWIRKEDKEQKIKKIELHLFKSFGWEQGRIRPFGGIRQTRLA